jgi:predicted dehydrogenase
MKLVGNPDDIRLAMLGMVEGNGHPYSWSAIFNGYDRERMAASPYPNIAEYLGRQPREAFGIPGARVTHICCDKPSDAESVARASLIPNVVRRSEDVIGHVDAVVIATDIGSEHLERTRPFIEAGVPLFIDKPLVDREDHLRQFVAWQRAGKPVLSTSCMRYSREFACREQLIQQTGQLRLITMTMAKTWERYGIHGLEGVYPFLAPGGWLSVTNTGTQKANLVHIRHAQGPDVLLATIGDLYGAFGCLSLYGTAGWVATQFKDTFHAFKTQLEAFIHYLRTGLLPFPFDETVELMKIIIAGIRSREEAGRTVMLSEIAC